MANFDESRWADPKFSQDYRDKADLYLPFRDQFVEIAKLGYEHFIENKDEAKILDLGCGDGLFIHALSKGPFSQATLVDGSSEMLEAAKIRLSKRENVHFVQASFQEILDSDPLNEQFDFIYSSLAMHHLPLLQKQKLYTYILEHLSPGGHFLHYDVVLSPSPKLEKWYLSLWTEWIGRHLPKNEREKFLEVPSQYKSNPDNIPDTLESQMDALKALGFINVDCIFKYGIFSLFGGGKKKEYQP